MQTKTIRFEKGEIYQHKDIPNFIGVELYFKFHHQSTIAFWHECLTSFTVQITVIEDEQD